MATETEILQALCKVMDPELNRNIVELGMVRNMTTSDTTVAFTLALTTLACPLRERIASEARQAIRAIDPALQISIEMAEMTREERQRILEQFRAETEQPLAAHLNNVDTVIAVMSGKGGVGKSSVAAMLAVTLRARANRVGILDADITGPSIPRMFNIVSNPTTSPLGIVPASTSSGIRVVSINLLLPHDDDAVIWRGPLISGAIKQFWNDVFWADLDYLILDLPPGTSDASLTVLQSIPLNGIVLVTSPQGLADMVVRKSAQMAQKLNVPLIGLIENMSYAVCPRCGERLDVFGPSQSAVTAELLGIPLLGRLPLMPDLAERCDNSRIEEQPIAPFEPIADVLLERVPKDKCQPIFAR